MLLWVVLRLKGPAAHGLSTAGAYGGAAAFGTATAQVMERVERVKGREERKERLNSAMGQSVRLLVPVRLHHQLLTAPLHLV